MKPTSAKRALAAQKLHNAYIHLLHDGKRGPAIEDAEEILMTAERFVRNGFSTKLTIEWFGLALNLNKEVA